MQRFDRRPPLGCTGRHHHHCVFDFEGSRVGRRNCRVSPSRRLHTLLLYSKSACRLFFTCPTPQQVLRCVFRSLLKKTAFPQPPTTPRKVKVLPADGTITVLYASCRQSHTKMYRVSAFRNSSVVAKRLQVNVTKLMHRTHAHRISGGGPKDDASTSGSPSDLWGRARLGLLGGGRRRAARGGARDGSAA